MSPNFRFFTKQWLVATAAMFALAGPSVAQSPNWTQVTGPGTPGYGGLVRFSQGTPDGTVWMMTEGGGLHKSTDNGATWTASNNGLTNLRIKAGIINTARTPYSLDAATYGGGVFDSVDAGASWVAMNSGLGCTYVTALTGVGSRLLAGTDCQSASGVYFIEAGQAWTMATGLPGNVRVNSISRVSNTNFAVDFLLANTDQGIFKSTDSGSTWAALPASPSGPNGAVVYNVRPLFYTPTGTSTNVTRLLATVEGAGIFVSEDGGSTWTASNTGLPANPVPMSGLRFDSNTSTLYLPLDGDGTYKSNDRGVSWTLAFAQNVLPSVRGVSPSSLVAGRLAADTLAGLRVSTDGGATWQGGGATGLPGGWTNNLKMDNATPTPNIYASAADGVYKFNGTQWAKMPPLPNMMYGQVKVRGSTVYATTSNKGVFKFNASTGAWNAINTGLPTNLVGRNPKYVGEGTSANNAYLGLYGDGVYYTSDAGAHWTARSTGLTGAALRVNSMDFFAGTNPYAYIATDGGVYKSTDGGLNWTFAFAPKNAAGASLPVGFVSVDPKLTTTVYMAAFNTDALGGTLASNGVYKSTDDGATWTQLTGMAGKMVRDVEFVGNANDTLVAAAWDQDSAGGLFASLDSGATWNRVSNGLTTNMINRVMTTSTGGYAATRGAGLFKFDDTSSVYSEWKYFGAWLDSNGALSYGVDFGVNDANQTLSGTSLSGNGQSAVGALDTGANQWNAHLQFGATAPASNTVFTAVTTPKTGTPTTSNFSLRAAGYNTAVPTNIQPSGGANVTAAQPVFSWSAPVGGSGAYSYQAQVRTAGMSFTQLWSSPNVSGTSVTYSGPALVPGTSYQLNVQTVQYDSPNNATYGAGASTTFCFQCGGSTVTGPNFDQLFIARNSGNGPENFGVGVRYPRTPNDAMAFYSVACPNGKTASGPFGTAVVSGTGYEWYVVNLGLTQPNTPFDCTSTVTYSDGSHNVATFTVDKFAAATAYPTAISLTANENVTSFSQVTFNNPVAGTANTRVQSNLWAVDANGNLTQQLWFVDATASPMTYNGPALTANTHYQLAIATVEGTGPMHAAQYWTAFCYQCTGTGTGPTLNVVSGWNLLGNSVEAPIDVATAFGTTNVTTVWKWLPGSPATATTAAVPSGWAFYSPALTDGGAAYAASKGYSFLTTINAGEGFWVNAANPFSGALPAGTPVASSSFKPALTNPVAAGGAHALGSGWSLLGTGDNPTPAAFDAALSTVISTPPAAGSNGVYTNLTTLWAWSTANGGGWYFWAPALVNNQTLAGYISSKNYIDFGSTGTLAPGVGFWVNMP